MRVKFYASAIKDREKDLADAMSMGVIGAGDKFILATTDSFKEPDPRVDMACVFALKGAARHILESYRAMGKRTLLIDKGLVRASTGLGGPDNYYRIALDEFMPLSRIERQMAVGVSADRWIALDMKVRPRVRSEPDSPIVYCAGSQKYSDFHDLGDEHDFAVKMVREIQNVTDRPIIYRPKPSFHEATAVNGATFSRTKPRPGDPRGTHYGTLGDLLPNAYALVTHGSHAGIDAIVGGVPLIALGPCAACPVANLSLDCLASGELFYPSKTQILPWLSAIAYWQWTTREMASGQMWRWLRQEMEIPA